MLDANLLCKYLGSQKIITKAIPGTNNLTNGQDSYWSPICTRKWYYFHSV